METPATQEKAAILLPNDLTLPNIEPPTQSTWVGGSCLVRLRNRDQQVMRQVIVRRAVFGFEMTEKDR